MRRKVIQHPSQEEAIAVRTTEQPPELGKQQARSHPGLQRKQRERVGRAPGPRGRRLLHALMSRSVTTPWALLADEMALSGTRPAALRTVTVA